MLSRLRKTSRVDPVAAPTSAATDSLEIDSSDALDSSDGTRRVSTRHQAREARSASVQNTVAEDWTEAPSSTEAEAPPHRNIARDADDWLSAEKEDAPCLEAESDEAARSGAGEGWGRARRQRQRIETRAQLLERLTNPPLSLHEAGILLGVCPATVRHYCDAGRLPHARTPGGQRRFRLHEVLSLMREMETQRKERQRARTPRKARRHTPARK